TSSRASEQTQLDSSEPNSFFADYFYRKLPSRSGCGRSFFEKLLFAIDQRIDVVGGELKPMAVRDRIRGARLHAITAENTARIIDVVHAGITLPRRNALRVRIFRGLDINTICRARRRTQEAPYALFQAAFVAVQHVNPAIARLKMHRLVRIILGDRLPKDISEGHAESLRERAERLGNLTDDVCHVRSLTNLAGARQTVCQPVNNPQSN